MNFIEEKIKPMYMKYLAAAFGSALISCIYGVVDMAMVGQYAGPSGAAALAVIAPIWNVIYSLGLLMGIGGSVIFAIECGRGDGRGEENQYFTVSVCGAAVLSIVCLAALVWGEDKILMFFGADSTVLPLAKEYLIPVKYGLPSFLFNQMLAAFLRNDKNPALATAAVLAGGIFNVFGDYFFVFTMDMGVYGAGLATTIGSFISLAVILTHFLSKKNSLRFTKVKKVCVKLKKITVTGFSTFFIDVAMGILTVLFNRQIMKYLGADALAVYGPIINISTFVQCCAYSVGQASQPIISANFGAGKWTRIRETLRCALFTTAIFGIFWTALSLICPNLYIHIFMKPSPSVLEIAPKIIRTYSLSFLLLPLNIFSTYYFQAVMKPTAAFIISVMRGLVISGALILLLPQITGADSVWLAMPITELAVMFYAVWAMKKYTK